MPTILASIFQLNSRYLSAGTLTRRQHHSFVRYETLRKEYLNQTFNFMPELQTLYDENSKGQNYEEAQRQITEKEDYSQLGNVLESNMFQAMLLILFPYSFMSFYLISGFDKSNTEANWFDENGNLLPIAAAVDYFGQMLKYTKTVKDIVVMVSKDIEDFVQLEQIRFKGMKQIPMILMIALAIFIPVVAYVTLQATSSMFK